MSPNTDKENLRKLLSFLKEQILIEPRNRWFVEELRNVIGVSSRVDTNVDNIKHYLGIDFKLDTVQPIIDYDFVKDEYLRNCLEADCREMLRYRFGTRGHKIDFSEFCRFAQMQAERLLNLFYSSKDGSIDAIKEHIKRYNPNANMGNNSTLGSINYSVKLWAYTEEFELKYIKGILDRVREVRNQQSHGGIQIADEERFFIDHRDKLKKDGYPLKDNGWVNWTVLQNNMVMANIYNTKVKDTKEHKLYIQIAWERTKPFDEVIECLRALAQSIAQRI